MVIIYLVRLPRAVDRRKGTRMRPHLRRQRHHRSSRLQKKLRPGHVRMRRLKVSLRNPVEEILCRGAWGGSDGCASWSLSGATRGWRYGVKGWHGPSALRIHYLQVSAPGTTLGCHGSSLRLTRDRMSSWVSASVENRSVPRMPRLSSTL